LQEAKDSSAIESIITTYDELYRVNVFENDDVSPQAKEVKRYAEALMCGYEFVQKQKFLTVNNICAIQRILENNNAGLRSQMGTVLKNATTGEVIYTPPQNPADIKKLMGNLETFINDDDVWKNIDPLVKMAVIHYQFESIHPFFDGNGRTGRIINVIYLVLKGLLDAPILYLSRHVIANKNLYYQRIRQVQQNNRWEDFVEFMLDAVIETSQSTIRTVHEIDEAMRRCKTLLRDELRIKFYSKDLVEALFLYPYTRIQHLQNILNVSRPTAIRYLNVLSESKVLKKLKYGQNLYFVNEALFSILSSIPSNYDSDAVEIVTDSNNIITKP